MARQTNNLHTASLPVFDSQTTGESILIISWVPEISRYPVRLLTGSSGQYEMLGLIVAVLNYETEY